MPTSNILKYPQKNHSMNISIYKIEEFTPDDLLVFLSKTRAVKVYSGADGQQDVTKDLKDAILQSTKF